MLSKLVCLYSENEPTFKGRICSQEDLCKIFSLSVDPFSEGVWFSVMQTGSQNSWSSCSAGDNCYVQINDI